MSWKVRFKEKKGKYASMTDAELAAAVWELRFTEKKIWEDIEKLVGADSKTLIATLRRNGYDPLTLTHSDIRNIGRNECIIKHARACKDTGTYKSQQGIADLVSEEGFTCNRAVVNGVLDRLLKSTGEDLRPGSDRPKRMVKRINKAFNSPARPGTQYSVAKAIVPEPLPPRTPELLAFGRVSYDDLRPNMCRYTPTEEAPFFFCGEATMHGKSWCRDCYENRIRKPAEEASPQRENKALAA